MNLNLHEECLLKFLLNPLDLADTTESLVQNNVLISRRILTNLNLVKPSKLSYTFDRI